jgi:hypothetical protein
MWRSANFVLKLSEKSQKIPKCGLTGNWSGTVRSGLARSATKSTLGALLKPLFRQFLEELDFSHLGVQGIDTLPTPLHNQR